MKKAIVILVVFSFILPLYAGSKAAMSKFMGHRWGTTADVFWNSYPYKEGVKISNGGIITDDYFQLTKDLQVRLTIFFFSESEIEFTKENYSKFRLMAVRWRFPTPEYETMVTIFKFKYGAPNEEKSENFTNSDGIPNIKKWCKWEASGRIINIEVDGPLDGDGSVGWDAWNAFTTAYMGPVDYPVREKKVNVEDAAKKF